MFEGRREECCEMCMDVFCLPSTCALACAWAHGICARDSCGLGFLQTKPQRPQWILGLLNMPCSQPSCCLHVTMETLLLLYISQSVQRRGWKVVVLRELVCHFMSVSSLIEFPSIFVFYFRNGEAGFNSVLSLWWSRFHCLLFCHCMKKVQRVTICWINNHRLDTFSSVRSWNSPESLMKASTVFVFVFCLSPVFRSTCCEISQNRHSYWSIQIAVRNTKTSWHETKKVRWGESLWTFKVPFCPVLSIWISSRTLWFHFDRLQKKNRKNKTLKTEIFRKWMFRLVDTTHLSASALSLPAKSPN